MDVFFLVVVVDFKPVLIPLDLSSFMCDTSSVIVRFISLERVDKGEISNIKHHVYLNYFVPYIYLASKQNKIYTSTSQKTICSFKKSETHLKEYCWRTGYSSNNGMKSML